MKRNELYYLLINLKTAQDILGFTNVELAGILGISIDTLRSWRKGARNPSKLNMYKMHWFVFLALEVKASYDKFLDGSIRLDTLTLDTSPVDTVVGHMEPWNDTTPLPYRMEKSTYASLPPSPLDSHSDFDDDFFDGANNCNDAMDPDDLLEDLDDSDCDDTDHCDSSVSSFKDLVNRYDSNAVYFGDVNVIPLFNKELHLNEDTYQAAMDKVITLLSACSAYCDHLCNKCLDNKVAIRRYYNKVHNYPSFLSFLKKVTEFAKIDDRFNPHNLDVYFIPVNAEATLIKDEDYFVDALNIYTFHFELTCRNGKTFRINRDETFRIGAFTHDDTLSYEFFIIHQGAYYKMEFNFNGERS